MALISYTMALYPIPCNKRRSIVDMYNLETDEKYVQHNVEDDKKWGSLVNQPVFPDCACVRKGEGEGKEKRSGQTRQVSVFPWNVIA